jgi:PBP1b-binding outer membrane lipoprotein LpoB
MKNVSTIELWATRISLALILIIFLKTCTTNTRIVKTEEALTQKIDSLSSLINRSDSILQKEIKIEGLRSEKRMIQSTDRKILDVNRQTEIDKTILELEK